MISQDDIFAPMGALALLTFAVLLVIPVRRVGAARRGQVRPEDFRYGESAGVPPEVSIPNRNYMNLLELPTLFYPACLMFYVTHRVGLAAVVTAWAFVACRAVHSVIHLTYNHVLYRLAAFALGNVALGVLWGLFFFGAGSSRP
jgi:hypothetical protein